MGIFNRKKTNQDDNKEQEAKQASIKKDDLKDGRKESTKDLYKEEKSKPETAAATKKLSDKIAHKAITKPLVTEKAAGMGVYGKYLFKVSKKTNKLEIAKAIEEIYGVKPEKVNIINMEGKTVRHGRNIGKRSDWKKALVTLPKGKSIDVYEGV